MATTQDHQESINNDKTEKEMDKIKHGYDAARADIENILILLEAALKKVKFLRNQLKEEGEQVSRKRIRGKCDEVQKVASPYFKTRKVNQPGNLYESYYEL